MGQVLNGQVIVVTGAGGGIGRAVTRRCLAEGASVVAGDLNAKANDELRRIAVREGFGHRLAVSHANVAIERDVAALVELAQATFGDFHGIVNNAGLPGAVGPLTGLRSEDWDQTLAVLTRGPFFGTKHAARMLIGSGHGGWIVNMASVAGIAAGAGPIAYSTAKAAVLNMTRASALELAKFKIRVNAVSPGMIVTPLTAPDAARGRADFARLQPWPVAGEADAVAGPVVFLASDDSRFVSGHNLVVDGGASIDIGMSARLRGTDAAPPVPGFNPGTSALA